MLQRSLLSRKEKRTTIIRTLNTYHKSQTQELHIDNRAETLLHSGLKIYKTRWFRRIKLSVCVA